MIVTGAAGGLGVAQVELLADEGAAVLAADVDEAAGMELAVGLKERGLDVDFARLDVTDEASWAQVVAAFVDRRGGVDVLVNNAGGALARAGVEERDASDWDRLMALNAKSVFLGTKHVLPSMLEAGAGSIVNVSSLAALGLASMMDATYAASKAAVTTFTKAVAAQYGPRGVRCNSVHPGAIETPMSRAYYADPEVRSARLSNVPIARFGQPEEVARAVRFLAGDESSYVTGAQLVVDGGSLVF